MHVAVIVLINLSSPSLVVSLICSNRLFGPSLTLGLPGNGWGSVCLADTLLWAQEKPCPAGGAWARQKVWAARMWKWVPRESRDGILMVTIDLRSIDWDDGGAELHVWEMGTWWDWMEEEMCDSQGLWNGEFLLRLSIVQARFLQCYHRHAVSVLQLTHFKSRVTLGNKVWAVPMYQLQNPWLLSDGLANSELENG